MFLIKLQNKSDSRVKMKKNEKRGIRFEKEKGEKRKGAQCKAMAFS